MYRSESSSPSRVTLALGLPSDRHRLLGGTVACVLFGEVVYQVGTSGLAQSLVPHFFARLIWTWVHPPDVDTHSGMQLAPIKPARPVSPGSAGQASQTSRTWLGRLTWLSRRPRLRDPGQHREFRPCTSRTNAARWLDVERPSFFYTPGFSTSFLHVSPSQRPVPGV